MHIVTASDNNYVPGVFVLLASVIKHNEDAYFTVIAIDWSDENLALLKALGKRLSVDVSVKILKKEKLAHLPVRRSHLTTSSYARLLIPDLLPEEERLIYMDCDMLVTGSLEELLHCDLTDQLVAAVRCPSPTSAFAEAMELPVEQYFNSGLMVLNLRLWRQEDLASRCMEAIAALDCPYLGQDESALNDVARGRVHYLPASFNVYARADCYQATLSNPSSIKVLHYIVKPKPWNGNPAFAELWQTQMAGLPELSGFKPTAAEPSADTLKKKLSRANRRGRQWMAGAFPTKKSRYKEQKRREKEEVKAFIESQLVPYYLEHGCFASDRSLPYLPSIDRGNTYQYSKL